MILTKKILDEYRESMRVVIPEVLEKELLDRFGDYVTDDEGHVREFTEQDIY